MSTISNKEAALLGLLSEGAMHPYDIEKEIINRNLRDWTEISMSSVYKVLAKLENEKLVNCMVRVSKNNRIQKIYSVTIAGHNAMKEWVMNHVSAWEKSLWPIDIAISNLSLLNNSEVVECFNKYIRSVEDNIKGYNDLLDYLQQNYSFHTHSLAIRPIRLLEAEKKWAEEILQHYGK